MQTIEFHRKPESRFFLAPDFTAIALSDESSISDAIDTVLRAKRKNVLPAERRKLVTEVERVAKGDTVGALRSMEEELWKKLEMPIICRVYLRQLILQSCSLTMQQLLECDFNSGFEFKWPLEKVKQLLALGVTRNEALEAILVTDNKQIELAAQYLLSSIEDRKLEYQRTKKRKNMYVPPDHHFTIIARMKAIKKQEAQWKSLPENKLVLEQMKLKNELNILRKTREQLEKQRDTIANESRLALYEEYLRGLTAEATLNTEELQHMERYRNPRKITKKEHLVVIGKIGFRDEAAFDKIKTYDTTNNEEDECVVCYEPPKDHMILPCDHVCLCPGCASKNFPAPHENQTCPLCSKAVQSVKQVYYF